MLINPEVRIETVSKCNGSCVMCPREKMTRPKTVMKDGLFGSLVLQAKLLGATHIGLFGYGEPLLDPKLPKRVSFCNRLDLKTFITTNATKLNTNKSRALLDAGLNHIRFSMHGIADNYEKVHPGFKWTETLRNIFNFAKMNDVQYDHQCRISITVIPMAGESIEQIKEFWKTMDDVEIWKPHNWTNGKSYRRVRTERLKTCGRPFNGPVQINADGKMMVCCFDFDAKLTIGDTKKNTIKEILNGEKINKIREAHKTGNMTGLICQECDQLNKRDNPLLYSSRDESCEIGKTSSIKFNLKEI